MTKPEVLNHLADDLRSAAKEQMDTAKVRDLLEVHSDALRHLAVAVAAEQAEAAKRYEALLGAAGQMRTALERLIQERADRQVVEYFECHSTRCKNRNCRYCSARDALAAFAKTRIGEPDDA